VAAGSGAEGGGLTSAALFPRAPVTVVTLAFQGISQSQLVPWHNALYAAGGVPFGAPPPGATSAPAPAAPAARPVPPPVSALAAPPAGSPWGVDGSPAPPFRVLNLLVLQGWFWKFAVGAVRSGTARALPPQLRDATAISVEPSAQRVEHFCDMLRVHNRMMAHVFLVDAAGCVRWRAHGSPAPGETDALLAAAQTLLNASAGRVGARKV
jgi:hypothetical protein